MDLQLEEKGSDLTISVDLAEDAGTRRNGATVEADVFHVPSNSLGSGMRAMATLNLEQIGPGWYESQFRPADPGVYLVRARAGSQIVSAGYVHNPSNEVATGRVNEELLREVCEITGGTYLENAGEALDLKGTNVSNYVELWPYLMSLFLVVFILDLCVRRWENVMGVGDQFLRLFRH